MAQAEGSRLTEAQRVTARRLKRNGLSYTHIATRIGSNYISVRTFLDPDYREVVKERNRDWSLSQRPKRAYKIREYPTKVAVPADVAHDRDRRLGASRTLTESICGDPAPGQAALDRMQKHTARAS